MLVQAAEMQIQLIPHEVIKNFLLSHLNPKAKNIGTLFRQNNETDGAATILKKVKKLPLSTSIVTLALAMAPPTMREELNHLLLALDPDDVIKLLQFSFDSSLNALDSTLSIYRDRILTYYALRPLIAQSSDEKGVALIEAIGRQDKNQIYHSLCFLSVNSQVSIHLRAVGISKVSCQLITALINSLNSMNSNLVADLFKLDAISPVKALALFKVLAILDKNSLMTLLVDSDVHATGYVGSKTILHLVFEKYPVDVVEQCLQLLLILSSDELEQLFLPLSDTCQTPLHYLLARNIDALTHRLFCALARNLHFRKLLLHSYGSSVGNSPLHEAVRQGNKMAIVYFVESPIRSAQSIRSLRQKALEHQQQFIIDLFDSLPLLTAIEKPKQNAQEQQVILNSFLPFIQRNPNIVNLEFLFKYTLLHRAVKVGSVQNLSFLLQQKQINVNAMTQTGETALDLALQLRCREAIVLLLHHSNSVVSLPDRKDQYLLLKILKIRHWEAIQVLLVKLNEISFDEAEPSFVQILKEWPISRQRYDEWMALMSRSSNQQKLVDVFYSYCEQHQDSTSLVLIEAGQRFDDKGSTNLYAAGRVFVRQQLERFNRADKELGRERLRNQLILLLFSIPTQFLLPFLHKLELNKAQQNALNQVLSYALMQPTIFSRLSQELFEVLFAELREDKPLLAQLIAYHFYHSDLKSLPLMILKQFAEASSFTELNHYNHQRLHPSLLLLTLEKALQDNKEDAVVADLFNQLDKELILLNQSVSPLPTTQLGQLLALAQSPEIKKYLKQKFAVTPPTSVMQQTVEQLFLELNKGQELPEGSFLRELFLIIAKAPTTFANKKFAAPLALFLSRISVSEVREVLNVVDQFLLTYRYTYALQSAAMPHKDHHDDPELLSQWLCGLQEAKVRIELGRMLAELHRLAEIVRRFAFLLNQKHCVGELLLQLLTLGEQLSDLINEVSANQFTDSLETLCKRLEALEQQGAIILGMSAEETLKAQIDDFIQTQLQSLLGNLENNVQFIAEIAKKQKQKQKILSLKFDAQGLHDWCATLALGMQQNQDIALLIPELLAWHRKNWIFAGEKNFFSSLFPFLQQQAQPIKTSLIQQLTLELDRASHIQIVIATLTALIKQPITMDELIAYFHSMDQILLAAFRDFVLEAELYDLHLLCDYILTGKEYAWDCQLLQDIEINIMVNHSKAWLQARLKILNTYIANVLSLKVLLEGLALDEEGAIERLTFLLTLEQVDRTLTPDAVIIFLNAYQRLLEVNLLSTTSLLISKTFNTFMQCFNAREKMKIIERLSSELLQLLLEQCLQCLHHQEVSVAENAASLLNCLCHYVSVGDDAKLSCLRQRLSRQDMNLLGSEDLLRLAETVFANKDDLADLTLDGVWIQRLLLSPAFLAAASSAVLQRLVMRYRALSLTLKQEEFTQLSTILAGKLRFSEQQQEAFIKYQQELLASPERKAALLAKRERLLQFRCDDAIRALFNQAEDNCKEMQPIQPEVANKALHTLYRYHNEALKTLRRDRLFRISNAIYMRATQNRGDIAKVQNVLLSWLDRHLPHYNFHQSELIRKQQIYLYNEQGQQIAFLTEANQVFCFINNELVPLIEVEGMQAGIVLYDSQRQRLGLLTPSNELQQENLFQMHTSALLLIKTPIVELEQSKEALKLLLQNLILENSVELVVNQCESDEKRVWLQGHLIQHLQALNSVLAEPLLNPLVDQLPLTPLLAQLPHFTNKALAHELFIALLSNSLKRKELLSLSDPSLLQNFFQQAEKSEILADIFMHHHDKPWFASLLSCLCQFTAEKPELLGGTLVVLNNRVADKNCPVEIFHAILTSLVSTEPVASVILQGLHDSPERTVQKAYTPAIHCFAEHFSKQHIIGAMHNLTNMHPWSQNNSQYRLLLILLHANPENFFPGEELCFAKQKAWQGEELKIMSKFLAQHHQQGNLHDEHYQLTERLYGELAFRAANYGQIDLFYTQEGRFNVKVADLSLKRSWLASLAARFQLVKEVKLAIESIYTSIKNWFLSGEALQCLETKAILHDNKALLDWQALANESWALTEKSTLPITTVFIMNYSGDKKPIERLIADLCHFDAKKEVLTYLAQILKHYPHRDVTHVIFAQLEALLTTQPHLINSTILSGMALFHAKVHLNKEHLDPYEAEVALITHFGQQKKYCLSQRCCELLLQENRVGKFFTVCPTLAKIKKAAQESAVEASINQESTGWFYKLSVSIKRWWYYGFSTKKNCSQFIKFCDDDSAYHSPVPPVPEKIRTETLSGQIIEAQVDYLEKKKKIKAHYKLLANQNKQGFSLKTEGLHKVGFFAANDSDLAQNEANIRKVTC